MRKLNIFSRLALLALVTCLVLGGCTKPSEKKPPKDSAGGVTDSSNGTSVPPNEAVPTNNLMSLSTTEFKNINGKTVTVDTFCRKTGERYNNPNVAQAIMLAQCIKYKQAHPTEEVYISITSFHFSIVAAACIDPQKADYGLMKSLYEEEYDEDGYVRLAYLVVYAAKIGINVVAVGHIDGTALPAYADGTTRPDISFKKYFESYLTQDSDIEGKKIGDYLLFREAEWTSYGDKAASDMMHVKSCTVSNYIDKNGKECGPAVWVGSTNIDGIDYKGNNGNNNMQTAAVITNHEEIRQVVYNYTRLMTDYCGQEEIAEFRTLVRDMNTKQTDLITEGRGEEIPIDQRIIYLGTENDSVFEFYFCPLGGAPNTWNTKYNPYSKYISKLLPATASEGYIEFAWINAKFYDNFEFSKTLVNILKNAFESSGRTDNRLHIFLPGFDISAMENLKVGENIGYKSINVPLKTGVHNKDFQLSYMEEGERYYVTALNSLNFHQGAMCYQTNSIFIIKETEATGNNVYKAHGKATTDSFIAE